MLKKQFRNNTFNREEFEMKIGVMAMYTSGTDESNDVAVDRMLINDMNRVIRLNY